jgi:hypothetical protein
VHLSVEKIQGTSSGCLDGILSFVVARRIGRAIYLLAAVRFGEGSGYDRSYPS